MSSVEKIPSAHRRSVLLAAVAAALLAGCGGGGGGGGSSSPTSAPSITSIPAAQTAAIGGSVTFRVVATGGGLRYQWLKGSTEIAGADESSYTIASVTSADYGTYSVRVTNDRGTVTVSTQLSVQGAPKITTQPQPIATAAGSPATFTVVASGDAPLSYQWYRNDVGIPGATAASYAVASANSTNAGTYKVTVTNAKGEITSNAVTLTIVVPVAPTISTQPAPTQTVTAGRPVSFSVVANGTAPLTYQWTRNGVNLSGTNSATFTINSVTAADAGTYRVVVSNSAGDVTSNAAVLNVNVAPVITTQPSPATQAVNPGARVEYSVVASGSEPLTYRWMKGSTVVSTSSTFVIASAKASDAGTYVVRVSNQANTVASNPVTLAVNAPPKIETGPTTVVTGSSTSVRVTVSGTAPFTYVWRRNGVEIPNSNGATYTIGTVTSANAGQYSVVVTNVAGSVTSGTVTVAAP